jgi:hypothetical protein
MDTPAARRCDRATASRSKTGTGSNYYQELRTADAWDQDSPALPRPLDGARTALARRHPGPPRQISRPPGS